jgi:glutathione S-transferase
MEDFHTKRKRLLAEQAERDAARANPIEPPLPPGKTREALFRDLKTAERTREQIRQEVQELSDREKPDPIKAHRDELKAKLQYATPNDRARIKARLEILDAKIAENDAIAAEKNRQADFAANPLVANARAMVENVRHIETLYPDVPPEDLQRLKAIANSPDFIDPEHFARTVSDALSAVETRQHEADERKHREALIATGQSFSTLNSAEAAALASKQRLEAAQKLGEGGENGN